MSETMANFQNKLMEIEGGSLEQTMSVRKTLEELNGLIGIEKESMANMKNQLLVIHKTETNLNIGYVRAGCKIRTYAKPS